MAAATDTLDGLESLLRDLSVAQPTPTVPGADVLHNPLDIYRTYLADSLVRLVNCEPKAAFDAMTASIDSSNGDVVIILPRLRLQNHAANPQQLGFEITQQFPSSPLFLLPVPDGVALRIFLSDQTLARLLLPYMADRGASYGTDPSPPAAAPKKLLIDFSSPNLAKEFTTGHLRSTLLGAHLAALHERMGWHVTRVNYLGDWGKNAGLLAAGWMRCGSDEALAADPLRHLLDVFSHVEALLRKEAELRPKADPREEKEKESAAGGGGSGGGGGGGSGGVSSEAAAAELEAAQAAFDAQGLHGERDALFKQLEDGAPEAVALWQRLRDVSIAAYTAQYARLGVVFDEYAGESQVSAASIARVEDALRAAGVYEEDHDACKVDFKKHGVRGAQHKSVLRFRNGTTTYLLRDIAAVLDREEKYGFDRMLYVVENQDLHFNCVFKALELMGRKDLVAKVEHVQFLRGPDLATTDVKDGNGSGHVQLLGDYLDLAQTTASNLLSVDTGKAGVFSGADSAAGSLGAAALIVQALHVRPRAAVTLDLTRAATFEGETGPALQYWHARLCAALRTAAGPAKVDYGAVDGEEYAALLRLLAHYPDVAKLAARNLDPHGLLAYLFRLVEELDSSMQDEDEGTGEAAELSPAEGIVFGAVRQVLENGMRALGMPIIASL